MKVIAAGMSKTGTKSMNAALTKLGYNVYDSMENLFLLCDEYNKITFEGWTTEDFRRMYENVDAVVDIPAFYFWDEIHRAFPDAKIILTVRDNEEQWLRSIQNQMAAVDNKLIMQLVQLLSPTCRRTLHFFRRLELVSMGIQFGNFSKTKINPSLSKKMYRAHNAYVQHTAPKDKLLVFKCKEGWGPLCDFLGVPEPNEPFPHKNIGGNVVNDIQKNTLFMKLTKEVLANSALIVAAAAVLTAMLHQYGLSGIYEGVRECMSSVFSYFTST